MRVPSPIFFHGLRTEEGEHIGHQGRLVSRRPIALEREGQEDHLVPVGVAEPVRLRCIVGEDRHCRSDRGDLILVGRVENGMIEGNRTQTVCQRSSHGVDVIGSYVVLSFRAIPSNMQVIVDESSRACRLVEDILSAHKQVATSIEVSCQLRLVRQDWGQGSCSQ